MRTKTIEGGGVSITLSESTIEMEIRRGYMADDGIRVEDSDPIVHMMRTFTWPTFTACVIAATGVDFPITFEEFRAMPGPLLSKWADAVYELNPSWKPTGVEDEAPKAETPTPSAEG